MSRRYIFFQHVARVASSLGYVRYGNEQARAVMAAAAGDTSTIETQQFSAYRDYEALLLGVVQFLWDATPETLNQSPRWEEFSLRGRDGRQLTRHVLRG